MMLTQYRQRVDKAVQELEMANRGIKEHEALLETKKLLLSDIKEAREVAQRVAKEVQSRAYGCIASVVSRCLEAIFEEPYEFRLDFVMKRGRTEVELWFVRDGNPIDPMTASGGGVVDVAAFALRLASLLMLGSARRRLLVLDEPFKFVSAEYRANLCVLLETLAKEMGIQIVMVSHIEELQIGKVLSMSASTE